MKKTFLVVLAVVFLTVVIAALWTHIVTKRSGEHGRSVDSVEYVDEALPEPQQIKESLFILD